MLGNLLNGGASSVKHIQGVSPVEYLLADRIGRGDPVPPVELETLLTRPYSTREIFNTSWPDTTRPAGFFKYLITGPVGWVITREKPRKY